MTCRTGFLAAPSRSATMQLMFRSVFFTNMWAISHGDSRHSIDGRHSSSIRPQAVGNVVVVRNSMDCYIAGMSRRGKAANTVHRAADKRCPRYRC